MLRPTPASQRVTARWLRWAGQPPRSAVRGITLVELLLVVGLMVSGLALATRSLDWIGTLMQPPSPAGASAAIWLVRDIHNATGISQAQACGPLVVNGITYSLDTSGHTLLRSGASTGPSRFPGVACIAYNPSDALPTLRVYSDRFPGSCNPSPSQAASGSGFRDDRCEYEEQPLVSRGWSTPLSSP